MSVAMCSIDTKAKKKEELIMAKTTQKQEMVLDVPTWANEGYRKARIRMAQKYAAKQARKELFCAAVTCLTLAFVIFELVVYLKFGILKWW